jgi:hypothetical protein
MSRFPTFVCVGITLWDAAQQPQQPLLLLISKQQLFIHWATKTLRVIVAWRVTVVMQVSGIVSVQENKYDEHRWYAGPGNARYETERERLGLCYVITVLHCLHKKQIVLYVNLLKTVNDFTCYSWYGQESFLFVRASRLAITPTHPLSQWMLLGSVGCEADHSLPPGAKFKNEWSYLCTPPCRHSITLNRA